MASRRACIAVRPGEKDGRCVCSAYGPPGSGPGLGILCGKANLKMIIGNTPITMSKRSKSAMSNLATVDFPPLAGSSLGQFLPTPEQFKESIMVAAGAGGSILIGSLLLPRAPEFFTNLPPLAKAGIVLGVAILGGGLLFRFSPQLAVGVIGGLGGLAIATAVGGFANVPITLGYLNDSSEEIEEAAAALEDLLPEERHLAALSATDVERIDPALSGPVSVRRITDPALAGNIGAWM